MSNTTSILKNSIKNYCANQIKSLKRIEELATDSIEFSSVSFNTKTLFPLNDYKYKKVLYYFEINEKKELGKIICDRISKYKKAKYNELKLPKVNSELAIKGNNTLYVGKSNGNFSVRLNQHFGKESDKTYALHLENWKEIIGQDVKLKLYYISFENIIEDEENDLLELIETSLHNSLKPILGRTGH